MPNTSLLPWLNCDWCSYGWLVLLVIAATQEDGMALWGEEDYDPVG